MCRPALCVILARMYVRAKVDLADQIYRWRQKLDGLGVASSSKRLMSGGMKVLMEHPSLFNLALARASWVNSFPRSLVYNGLNDWGKREHEMPPVCQGKF